MYFFHCNLKVVSPLFFYLLFIYGMAYIEEIFEHRNQQYGAYVLRKSYPRHLTVAFGYTVVICLAAILGYVFYDYQQSKNLPVPFKIKPEIVAAPWNSAHQLVYLKVQYDPTGRQKEEDGDNHLQLTKSNCSGFVPAQGKQDETVSKLNISFNPNKVKAYRFLGYESQSLLVKPLTAQFYQLQDTVKNLPIGHLVAVLYEIVPMTTPTSADTKTTLEDSTYQSVLPATHDYWQQNPSGLFQLSFRYSRLNEQKTRLIYCNIHEEKPFPLAYTSSACQFAVAVCQNNLPLLGLIK